MSQIAVDFLTAFAQALSALGLYPEGHRSRERALDAAYEKLDTARQAVIDDISKQKAINDQIAQQQRDQTSADPMELARRMQANMMKDPQNARKYMEQMQHVGQQVNAGTVPTLDKDNQMKSEAEALNKRFQAALDVAGHSANERWAALKKKRGYGPLQPMPGELEPAWVYTEWNGIQQEWQRAYNATCPTFFGAGGQAHAFLARYKDYLVTERIPYYENFDAANVANYQMFNTPAASYKSLATLEAVKDHIGMAQTVFGYRKHEPICRGAVCK